jgi:NhaP-type Na+/H+ or K+/H+ antiporter
MKIDLPSVLFVVLGPLLFATAWRVLGREVIEQWAPAVMAVIAIG